MGISAKLVTSLACAAGLLLATSADKADAANLAYLIYPSGSPGRPKAVAIEHRQAVAMVRWAHRRFGRDELLKAAGAAALAPPPTQRLADAKSNGRYGLVRSLDNTERIASTLARFVRFNRSYQTLNNYYRMVEYMSGKSKSLVSRDAWYLSIIAVDPSLHGRGLGQQLLSPTLAEADANAAISYLETFGPRTVRFYQRLGFSTVARFDEPTTGAQYALMVRNPRTRHA